MSPTTPDRCSFSTYGYACGKPVEHGRYLCDDHATAKCVSCGKAATHGCDFCGQFVCGMPLCDECTYGTDETKSAGAWGFMNHIHVSKPEFALKHENARLTDAVDAAHKRIAELEAGGWQPIESAPKDGKHVLLCVQSGAFFYAVEGACHAGEWLAAFHREPVQPVYWAPKPTGFVLPAPPSRIDKEDRNG